MLAARSVDPWYNDTLGLNTHFRKLHSPGALQKRRRNLISHLVASPLKFDVTQLRSLKRPSHLGDGDSVAVPWERKN